MRGRSRVFLLAFLLPMVATGEVVRIDVIERDEVLSGREYGLAGQYEMLRGRFHFAVNPGSAINQRITDIEYAPVNASGKVAFSADFLLIKPKSIERGNGAVLFEVPNRGRTGMLARFHRHTEAANDLATGENFGDGFLLKRGFTLLWLGWQFDVPDRPHLLRAFVPSGTNRTEPIRGVVRSDFFVSERTFDHSLGDRGHIPYPVADVEDPRNVLTVRATPTGSRKVVSRDQWRFGRQGAGGFVPDRGSVWLGSGFEPKRIYEVVYVSQDPPIAGLGLAAIRDAISHLRHGSPEELAITKGAIDRAIAYGASQSGRLLRTFLYDGFNEDERGRKVFDGVIAHLAGGQRGGFNQRFAQPSRSGEMNFFYPNAMFPFTDTSQTDPMTGRRDGLLANVRPEFIPKIFYTNSSTEYWISPGALSHISVDASSDITPPDTSRIYHFSGTQHAPSPFPPAVRTGEQPANPNDYGWFLRALLVAMDRWVTAGSPPPPSRYPRLDDETLVAPGDLAFPERIGAAPPDETPLAFRLDFGSKFADERLAEREPPRLGPAYPQRVPQVDADGNELGGLETPALSVPLATYTGWRPFDSTAGGLYVPLGSGLYLPLPKTESERSLTADPRSSIQARYGDRERYLGLTAHAALELVEQGYLLASDVPEVLERARRHWDHLMPNGQEP